MKLCVLGRQPALGRAELESLYGEKNVVPAGAMGAIVNSEVDFSRLGGTVKAGELLTTLPSTNPQKAFTWLQKNIASHIEKTDGKLKLGISLYGFDMHPQKVNANALSLKKALRATGQSVRVIPNKEPALSSAQSYQYNLHKTGGCELLILKVGADTVIARLTNVQDLNAYTVRDRERPKRDVFVGMLPPKLAQIIINLASSDKKSDDGGQTLLDPFCGTGVILQEASLMGKATYGTDNNEKMIDYSRKNLEWLSALRETSYVPRLEVADATDHTWHLPIDAVACEGYLGHPFNVEPSPAALKETMMTCNLIMKKFLRNIASQLQPGTRLCVAAPAWFIKDQQYHLPVIETLETLGYERVNFRTVRDEDLLYRRDDQVVGRELLVLIKK
jgi:tRNA G10  N-methylase Trm11